MNFSSFHALPCLVCLSCCVLCLRERVGSSPGQAEGQSRPTGGTQGRRSKAGARLCAMCVLTRGRCVCPMLRSSRVHSGAVRDGPTDSRHDAKQKSTRNWGNKGEERD
jgi:hypothetical protein